MFPRKIVAGLGNPGEEYKNTPHNLGFEVVDLLVAESGASWHRETFQALVAHPRINGIDIVLVKPQAYMNLSGESIGRLMSHYGMVPKDLIVILDDLALPFGRIRIRGRGSAGGHKGLESIVGCLGTHEFVRIRLGIGLEEKIEDAAEYVLRPIPKSLRRLKNEMVIRGKEVVKTVCLRGLQVAMNKFN